MGCERAAAKLILSWLANRLFLATRQHHANRRGRFRPGQLAGSSHGRHGDARDSKWGCGWGAERGDGIGGGHRRAGENTASTIGDISRLCFTRSNTFTETPLLPFHDKPAAGSFVACRLYYSLLRKAQTARSASVVLTGRFNTRC